jgi:hypothetical protein
MSEIVCSGDGQERWRLGQRRQPHPVAEPIPIGIGVFGKDLDDTAPSLSRREQKRRQPVPETRN